jgi:hypothetical protein
MRCIMIDLSYPLSLIPHCKTLPFDSEVYVV